MAKRNDLDQLLETLDQRAEEDLAQVVVEGRALSKSEDALHIAVADGIVAVPFNAIEEFQQFEDARKQPLVSVVVRDADAVRQVVTIHTALKPDPLWDPPGGIPVPRPRPTPGPDPGPIAADGDYYRTWVCDDTKGGSDQTCRWMSDKDV